LPPISERLQAAWRQPTLIRSASPVRFRGLQLRRSQRSPGADNLGLPGATPGAASFDPVVQRQRPLAYTQVTMVRVHPGSLAGRSQKSEIRWVIPDSWPLTKGCSSNGRTLVSQAGNRGSTPRRSTASSAEFNVRAHRPMGRHLPGVQEIRVQFPVGPLTGSCCNGSMTLSK
jgi:hypothetical protein